MNRILLQIAFYSFAGFLIVFGYLYMDKSSVTYSLRKQSESYADSEPSVAPKSLILYADQVVNSDGPTLVDGGRTNAWIGTGAKDSSILGLHFSNLRIPSQANVSQATLTLTAATGKVSPFSAILFAEKSASPLLFSKENPPSTRLLTQNFLQFERLTAVQNGEAIVSGNINTVVNEALHMSPAPTTLNLIISGVGPKNTRRVIESIDPDIRPSLSITY